MSVVTRRSSNNALEAKSNMPRALKAKLSRNQRNNKTNDREKFCIKVPNSTREALMMDIMNNNTPWGYDITKDISALEILCVLQYYTPKTKFEKNDIWQWAPIWIIFDIKQQYLRHNASLVFGGHVVDSS